MGWLTGFLKVVTVVPACIEVAQSIVDGFDKITSNAPKAKLQALQRCKAESERLHQKAKEDINTMYAQAEQSAKEAEEAADRRLREQKEENDRTFEELRNKMKLDEEKHDEDIRKMKKDHADKMKKLTSENKEAREQMEREHERKMNGLDKKYTEEKKKAEEKLEVAKVEGEKKIKKAEEEKEKVVKERQEAQRIYGEEMMKLEEANQQQILRIHEETAQMKIENIKERGKQIKEANRLTLEQLEKGTAELVSHLTLEESKELVSEFRKLLEPAFKTRNSLVQIHAECDGFEAETGIPPGILDEDFKVLVEETARYNNQVRTYRQVASNSDRVDTKLHDTCNEYIKKLDRTMAHRDLLAVQQQMPRAIDNGRTDKIREYCDKVGNLEREITSFKELLDSQFEKEVASILNGGTAKAIQHNSR